MYQVLARKYRPRNFSQLVGQTHVSKALTSALTNNRLHHAYLFTGTRGVGKTTIARILAKCLNCETGVTATPCEECTICRAVNEGRFIDLIEIDAASRTRVEDTRELLDNVPYAPTQGRYKVYLIDEVHMLSTHSFNALLKTLEEPPEHVKFLFATTDPQKLPITVISRCLQFTLRPLVKDEIFQHLAQILTTEELSYEDEALWQLAESAQGSLRDALSLTDQAIAYGQGQVLSNDVQDMLGIVDNSLVFDLLSAIHQNHREKVAQLMLQMRQQAIDVTHVLAQIISLLHDVALKQCLGSNGAAHPDEQFVMQLAALITPQDIQLYYQIAVQGRADLALALTPEQGFEMCVLRLLAFRPMASGEVVEPAAETNIEHKNPAPPEQNIEVTSIPSVVAEVHIAAEEVSPKIAEEVVIDSTNAVPTSTDSDVAPILSEQPEHVESANSNNPIIVQDIESTHTAQHEHSAELATANKQFISVEEELSEAVAQNTFHPSTAPTQQAIENIDPRTLLQPQEQQLEGQWNVEKWDYWLRQAAISTAAKEMAQNSLMQGDIAGVSQLIIDPQHEKVLAPFLDNLKAQLQQMSPTIRVEVIYQQIQQDTPVQLQQSRRLQAHTLAENQIKSHPVIGSVLEQFSASIVNLKLKTE